MTGAKSQRPIVLYREQPRCQTQHEVTAYVACRIKVNRTPFKVTAIPRRSRPAISGSKTTPRASTAPAPRWSWNCCGHLRHRTTGEPAALLRLRQPRANSSSTGYATRHPGVASSRPFHPSVCVRSFVLPLFTGGFRNPKTRKTDRLKYPSIAHACIETTTSNAEHRNAESFLAQMCQLFHTSN